MGHYSLPNLPCVTTGLNPKSMQTQTLTALISTLTQSAPPAQSYLVSLYLDCPEGMNLHCPDADSIAAVSDAIQEGVITWHAFPHNAQARELVMSSVWQLRRHAGRAHSCGQLCMYRFLLLVDLP